MQQLNDINNLQNTLFISILPGVLDIYIIQPTVVDYDEHIVPRRCRNYCSFLLFRWSATRIIYVSPTVN